MILEKQYCFCDIDIILYIHTHFSPRTLFVSTLPRSRPPSKACILPYIRCPAMVDSQYCTYASLPSLQPHLPVSIGWYRFHMLGAWPYAVCTWYRLIYSIMPCVHLSKSHAAGTSHNPENHTWRRFFRERISPVWPRLLAPPPIPEAPNSVESGTPPSLSAGSRWP